MASLPWDQQIQRAYVPGFNYSSTMEFRVFSQHFYEPIKSAVDIVMIYDNNNTLRGFGVVSNEDSRYTGGHFSTVPYWADRLRIKIAGISNTLRDMHCPAQAQNIGLATIWIGYAQLQGPLISSLLQQSRIVSFFKNPRPSYDFTVVALFPDNPCGFGFIQTPPVATANVEERSYLIGLRALVHQLMEIVDGGITEICGRSFVLPARLYSSRVPSAMQQHQLPGWDSNLVMQHQQPESSIHSHPTAVVIPYEDPNTASGTYMWTGQLTSSSRLSGGERITHQWPGSTNSVVMQQPQSMFSQPTILVIPGSDVSTGRLSGDERNANRSSGSRNEALMQQQPFFNTNYSSRVLSAIQQHQLPGWDSNLVMQHQQTESSIHSHPTAVVIPHEDPNTTSGTYMWTGQLTSSSRLSGGERITHQWPGSTNAAVMQQPQSMFSQPTISVIPAVSTGRLSGDEGNANQSSGSRNEALMQQKPDSFVQSRPAGDNRLGQNRDA